MSTVIELDSLLYFEHDSHFISENQEKLNEITDNLSEEQVRSLESLLYDIRYRIEVKK